MLVQSKEGDNAIGEAEQLKECKVDETKQGAVEAVATSESQQDTDAVGKKGSTEGEITAPEWPLGYPREASKIVTVMGDNTEEGGE